MSTDSPWCAYDLFLTQDFGSTWVNLTSDTPTNGVAAFWGL